MKKIILSSLIFALVLLPQIVLTQGLQKAFGEGSPLKEVAKGAGVEQSSNIGTVAGQIIRTALTLVGLIFLVLMVYAGYLWMTARGEEEPIKKAQKIVTGSIIGLVLVMSAYAITIFVTSKIGK